MNEPGDCNRERTRPRGGRDWKVGCASVVRELAPPSLSFSARVDITVHPRAARCRARARLFPAGSWFRRAHGVFPSETPSGVHLRVGRFPRRVVRPRHLVGVAGRSPPRAPRARLPSLLRPPLPSPRRLRRDQPRARLRRDVQLLGAASLPRVRPRPSDVGAQPRARAPILPVSQPALRGGEARRPARRRRPRQAPRLHPRPPRSRRRLRRLRGVAMRGDRRAQPRRRRRPRRAPRGIRRHVRRRHRVPPERIRHVPPHHRRRRHPRAPPSHQLRRVRPRRRVGLALRRPRRAPSRRRRRSRAGFRARRRVRPRSARRLAPPRRRRRHALLRASDPLDAQHSEV